MLRTTFLLTLTVGLLSFQQTAHAQRQNSDQSSQAATANRATKFTAADLEYFEKKIRPLLFKRCYKCHTAVSKLLRGGLRLDNRNALLRGGDSGPAVVPGKPGQSLLIEAVRYDNTELQMPPSGKLPDAEIAELVRWVQRRAPAPAGQASQPIAERKIDFAKGRTFWSFQPPQRSKPPAVQKAAWPKRGIDAFVLARLEKGGLHPSTEASRRTLIRRASFDLIGLPPTAEEVEQFLNDQSADAYARLIERLLTSPHYGERWARFWLDLARYSDSTASWLKSTGQAHLYRDWVIRALNDDLPYDQFVRRQLAADLMPDNEVAPADSAALGFLGLSPTYWKELKLDKDVIKTVVAEEWEERINTVSRTFLGLTVACARCHDHKFDPISSADYYALAGVFASTRLADAPIISAAKAVVAEKARNQVTLLHGQIKKLQAKQPVPAAAQQQIKVVQSRIEKIKQSTPHFDTPLAHAVEDAALYVLANGPDNTKLEYKPGEPRDVPLYIRGNTANSGPLVPRRFLTVLTSGEPKPFQHGSGRLELANAILNEGAPLAARVVVNRIWKQHFGRGLVDTPSNFGSQGSRPSHPELLDDLTARFVQAGWSIKWLHRELMLSATYRQSSAHDAANHAIDPGNRWLWRMNRRRLNIESWRDAMLAVAGTLDKTIGGRALDLSSTTNNRRTIYGKIARRQLHDMLRLHDFPDPTAHSPGRESTTTPLQQLFVLNSQFVERQSTALAARLKRDAGAEIDSRIRHAYALLFAHESTSTQLQLGIDFLTAAETPRQSTDAVWIQYSQVLLGSNEFLFID